MSQGRRMAEKSLPNTHLRERFLAAAERFGEDQVIDFITIRMGWTKGKGSGQPQTTFDRRHGFRVMLGIDRNKRHELVETIPHQRAGQVHRLLSVIEKHGNATPPTEREAAAA